MPRTTLLRVATGSAVTLTVLLCQGCWSASSELKEKIARCATLEGARKSKLPELSKAAKEISQQGGAPGDLTRDPGEDATNAAAALAKAMDDGDRLRLMLHLDELARPADGVYPEVQLDKIAVYLLKEQKLLGKLRQASAMQRCASGVRFELGFFDRYPFLDDASIAARLLMLASADALRNEKREQAFKDLIDAAQWVQWLAVEHRLEGRLLACRLRIEWLALLQSITEREVGEGELNMVFSALREQLNRWPPDRDSLVGDRALGMHAYEAVRLGMMHRVVTPDESKQLDKEGVLDKIKRMDGPSIDRDQWAYLRVMNAIISESGKPYFQRVDTLLPLFDKELFDDQAKQQSPMATRLYLVGVPEALEQMARDRALVEGWSLAIASAAGYDLPPYRRSPLNGKLYGAEREEGVVIITLGDFEVPNPRVRTPADVSSR